MLARWLAGCAIGALIAAGTVLYLAQTREDILGNTEREMRNMAVALTSSVENSFRSVELFQEGMREWLRAEEMNDAWSYGDLVTTRELHETLKARIAALPQVRSAFLTDATGRLMASSLNWPASRLDLGSRDYFRAIADYPGRGSYLSGPLRNVVTGDWNLVLAHRITAEDGTFLGIIAVTITLDHFEQFFGSLALGEASSIGLFRNDGILLARYPQLESRIGYSAATGHLFPHLADAPQGMAIRGRSQLDGRPRILGFRSPGAYSIYVVATREIEDALKPWYKEVWRLGSVTLIAELMIFAGVGLMCHQLRQRNAIVRLQRAQNEAETQLALAAEREESNRALAEREAKLRASDTMLRLTMSVGLIGGFRHDVQTGMFHCDKETRLLHGIPPGHEPIGRKQWLASVVPEDRPALMAVVERAVSEGEREATADYRVRLGQDRVRHVEVRVRLEYNADGAPTGALGAIIDVTERREADARIAHLAHHDTLTDLPNRALFRIKLDEAISRARRGESFAVLCLDLDHFKEINDTLGHPVGDRLLEAVAKRLLSELREQDTLARIGGDEFAIIETNIGQPRDATQLASRLVEAVGVPYELEGHQVVIGASIGIAIAPGDGLDPDLLLKSADMALYRAKADGRGRWRYFEPEMDAQMQLRRSLETDLRRALGSGEFEVFYQPIVNVGSRQVTGLEALLRWRHPERGLVPPDSFIPLAEEIGLIVPLGEWVLRRACQDAQSWPGHLRLAVNLSSVQFNSRTLVDMVAAALDWSGLAPTRLELEITETVMLHDTDATLATLHRLKALGVWIAMDDFGTGYSSLSYLQRFPFDKVKIDRTFIHGIGQSRKSKAIIRAVTDLCAGLEMTTTAEGVETEEQFAALARKGCTEAQGFLFSKPCPASAVPGVLRELSRMSDRGVSGAAELSLLSLE